MAINERAFFNRASHKLVLLHRAAIAADHDEAVGEFSFHARAVTLCNHAPRRYGVPAARGFACAPAHRMVNGILCHRPAEGTDATVPGTASLAEHHVFVLRIANLAYGGVTALMHSPDFSGRQPDLGIALIAGHQGCRP